CVFFFQAEDGIRDWSVTGVQTCALPICGVRMALFLICPQPAPRVNDSIRSPDSPTRHGSGIRAPAAPALPPPRPETPPAGLPARSEERRVGKECSSQSGQ